MAKIAVLIASAGRKEILTQVASFMQNQVRAPDEFIISIGNLDDIDRAFLENSIPNLVVVTGALGLPAQRNCAMSSSTSNIGVFFDDDFLPASDYLLEIEKLFAADSSIVVATGSVLEDGIGGPGLDFSEGLESLSRYSGTVRSTVFDCYNAYGCNMAIQLDVAKNNRVLFDENLPLYAWQEDVDFSRGMAKFGRVVKASAAAGIHLGTKRSGRSPGKRLGYSQIANPIYLSRKGTVSWNVSLKQICRNVSANIMKSMRPEPWVDRRGRLIGNILGLKDVLIRRDHPKRALELDIISLNQK